MASKKTSEKTQPDSKKMPKTPSVPVKRSASSAINKETSSKYTRRKEKAIDVTGVERKVEAATDRKIESTTSNNDFNQRKIVDDNYKPAVKSASKPRSRRSTDTKSINVNKTSASGSSSVSSEKAESVERKALDEAQAEADRYKSEYTRIKSEIEKIVSSSEYIKSENEALLKRNDTLDYYVKIKDAEILELRKKVSDKELDINELSNQLIAVDQLRNHWEYLARSLLHSTSWRVTAPFRKVASIARYIVGQPGAFNVRIENVRSLVRSEGIVNSGRILSKRLGQKSAEDHHKPDIHQGKRRFDTRAEFANFLATERANNRTIFAELPIIDWNVPLYQRPQHIATAFGRSNTLVVYTTSNVYDKISGYVEVEPGVWVTDDGGVYDLLEGAICSIYSTAHFDAYDMLKRVSEKNVIMYEYIDHIDPAISGDGVVKLQKLKDFCFSGGADVIVASAKKLKDEAIKAIGEDNVCFAPNGVDYEHYKAAMADPKPVSAEYSNFLMRYPKIIGYFGALAPWIWYEMINDITATRPDLGFVFIGPDYYGGFDQLEKRDNVFAPGAINYTDLPHYALHFDVAMIPFRHGDIAQTTSPLKLFEYFALEKPVVVTDQMLECTVYPEVFKASNSMEFISRIDEALNVCGSKRFKRRLRKLALENTWDERAKAMKVSGIDALRRKGLR
ncbi:hypothetical protein [Zhengella mangrovi]|uniref:hypothetical protein n=1 Tax=Zhengella mangrovi TaxID=1982044 RepID=UPI001056C718|nr:hypothetical protein [Zhengella mangrovi]